MKNKTFVILSIIGFFSVLYGCWHLLIYFSDNNGFWYSYYCSEIPVTVSEVDTNHDGHVQREEAAKKCDGLWLQHRVINEKACIEYMEPKTGIPLMTACRINENY